MLEGVDYVVLDGRRVTTVDAAGREVLAGLRDITAANGVHMICCRAPECAHGGDIRDRADEALEWCEDALLRECGDLDRITGEFSTHQLLAGLDRDARAAVDALTELRHVEAGDDVFCEGDAPDGIYSVVSGSLSVLISTGRRPPAHRDPRPGRDLRRDGGSRWGSALDIGAGGHRGHLQGAHSRGDRDARSTVSVGAVRAASRTSQRELSSRLRDANEEIRALA